jgi:hypothetical protein
MDHALHAAPAQELAPTTQAKCTRKAVGCARQRRNEGSRVPKAKQYAHCTKGNIGMAQSVKASSGTRKAQGVARRPTLTARLPAELVNRIDVWAGEHDSTRAEAIRTLVEIGLTTEVPHLAEGGQGGRAATLAGQQIDRMGDASATSEERANRKVRLTEGPSIFREVRHDRQKRKTRE